MTTLETRNLAELLQRLVSDSAHIRYVVAFTDDGLLLEHSDGIDTVAAEKFAALAASIVSGSRAIPNNFGGGRHRQTTIELEQAFVLLSAAGENAGLAVSTCDVAALGTVAYETQQLVREFSSSLSAARRERYGAKVL